MQQATC